MYGLSLAGKGGVEDKEGGGMVVVAVGLVGGRDPRLAPSPVAVVPPMAAGPPAAAPRSRCVGGKQKQAYLWC